jgi:hypothetical protein
MGPIDETTQNEPGGEKKKPPNIPASREGLEEENRRLKEELGQRPPGARPRKHRIRRVTAAILVVLTSLFALLAVIGVWAQQSIYNTDRFTAVVTPVAGDPQVVDPLATYLSVQTIQALDLQDRIKGVLQGIAGLLPNRPAAADRLGALAGPLTSAAQNFVHGRVQAFLHSAEFRQLFNTLVVTVHGKLVALLNGEYQKLPNLEIQGATVYLNTIPIIGRILHNIAESAAGLVGLNVTIPEFSPSETPAVAREKLSQALGVTLPPNFGQIPLMSANKLHSYQNVAHRFNNLVLLFILLAAGFFALTIVVSPRRRRTLVQLGLGITVTFVLAAILLRVIVHHAIDQVQSSGGQEAARDVVNVMAHNLREAAAFVLWPAVALAVIAYLAGRPRWAVRFAQWFRRVSVEGPEGSSLSRWVAEQYDWVVGGSIGLAVLLLFIFGISWPSVIVIGALLAAVLWWATSVRAGERKRSAEATAA